MPLFGRSLLHLAPLVTAALDQSAATFAMSKGKRRRKAVLMSELAEATAPWISRA
jgi:hypothetical protein